MERSRLGWPELHEGCDRRDGEGRVRLSRCLLVGMLVLVWWGRLRQMGRELRRQRSQI